jgi:hypothetical protein
MSRHYRPLTTITFEHGYYADQVCGDIILVPTAETAVLLPKYRLLFGVIDKKRPSSYQILQENVETAPLTYVPLIPLPTSYELRFEMQVKNAAFMNFTKFGLLAPKSSHEIYYFENQSGIPSPLEAITNGTYQKMDLVGNLVRLDGLMSAVTVSVSRPGGSTLFTTTAFAEGSGFVALVELDEYAPGVYILDWGGTPKKVYHDARLLGKGLFGILQLKVGGTYSIGTAYAHTFEVKSPNWTYYVLLRGDGHEPYYEITSVSHGMFEAVAVGGEPEFDVPPDPYIPAHFSFDPLDPLGDPIDTDDPYLDAAMIASKVFKAIVFVSEDEFDYSEVARSFITLTRTFPTPKTIVEHLPNPSAGNPNPTVIVIVESPI